MPSQRIRPNSVLPARRERLTLTTADGLDLVGGEEEAMPRLTHEAQVFTGVILDHHRKMDVILEILFDGLNNCRPTGQHQIEGVSATTRF